MITRRKFNEFISKERNQVEINKFLLSVVYELLDRVEELESELNINKSDRVKYEEYDIKDVKSLEYWW